MYMGPIITKGFRKDKENEETSQVGSNSMM